MPDAKDKPVDTKKVKALLKRKKARMKLSLAACAGCSLCAESCFLYKSKGRDPRYMPSYKVLQTLGKLYRKRGEVSRAELEQMKDLLWTIPPSLTASLYPTATPMQQVVPLVAAVGCITMPLHLQ